MIKKNPSNKPLPPRADGTSAPARRLLTVREACEYGRFGHTKCYEYINAGEIIAYKRGHRTMIDADSIDAFNASLKRIEPKAAAQ
ncbi:helix-turn-helix domain-containing protein [Bradyrhizobium sp. BRP22]|uniref:helix-turn-helix domain-containing protein n=1 Tax=Bradyrhizobium sp. BRP22 TaxID=2793821 RepID=UPI001CD21225|nr:helix-turn-helix domain-containing protein [Bradyrhizobium sp. BRP22]MCA1453975.1 helix-turn-helix domain-containing protein [Bradyrhizobium sp. BRP22]